MKKFNVGFIGLGARGSQLIRDIVLDLEWVNMFGICDIYQDRVDENAKYIEEKTGKKPNILTCNYEDITTHPDVEVVIIASAWESHVDIAVSAMENKKAVGLEVGGAYCVDDCWRLVEAYEKTKTPFMFLENCCFGRREMMALNMAQLGLFGEIVHCDGGYQHDLRWEISYGKENRHYRLRNYLTRNCHNYPTHDLGPISKVLNINHGNRILTLTSIASKSVSMHDYIAEKKADDESLLNAKFNQGDIVTTILKCANGETIVLTLDTTLPRYYSRNFRVRGTKGMYEEVTDSVFLDSNGDAKHDTDWLSTMAGNAKKYEEKYDHPLWKEYLNAGVSGSHGGMDLLEFQQFFTALENGDPMPVDVYDAALWMSITPLSEYSISKGGATVEIPDFTRGKWILNNEK